MIESIIKTVKNSIIDETQNLDKKFYLALSGGVDSIVLFHILRHLNIEFKAIHVNHQISENATSWGNFCQDLCNQHNINLEIYQVDCSKKNGESLEDVARQRRYAIFNQLECDYLLMAHHQDDQIETFFTQLLRGSGINGLLGIPKVKNLKSCKLLRPMLNISKKDILQFSEHFDLKYIFDESNDDIKFARNFLRHKILPEIEIFYPQYRKNIERTQSHLKESFELNQRMILDEFKKCFDEFKNQLDVVYLLTLDKEMIKQIFRHYFFLNQIKFPTEYRLDEIIKQTLTASSESNILIKHGDFQIRRFKNKIYVQKYEELINFEIRIDNFLSLNELDLTSYKINYKFNIKIYDDNIKNIDNHLKIDVNLIKNREIVIKNRVGGERFSLGLNRPKRSLKQQFQHLEIPPSLRENLPIFYVDNKIFYIPYLGVEADFQIQQNGQPFVLIEKS